MKYRIVVVYEIEGEFDPNTVDPHEVAQDIDGIYQRDEPVSTSWPIEGCWRRMLAAEWEDEAQRHGLQKMLDADGEMI